MKNGQRRIIRTARGLAVTALLSSLFSFISPAAIADTSTKLALMGRVTAFSEAEKNALQYQPFEYPFTLGLDGLKISEVSSGGSQTCVLASGDIYCWGQTSYFGSTNRYPTKIQKPLLFKDKTFSKVDVSSDTSCALMDSQAFCWGNGSSGEIGNGSNTSFTIPTAVSTLGVLAGKRITDISVGSSHVCAIADGQVFCWGANGSGQLGNGTTTNSSAPVAVSTIGALQGKSVTKVSAGGAHTCAIASSQIYCWGSNSYYILGNNSVASTSNVPVAVDTSGALAGKSATDISAGQSHTCALASGTAVCWGANNYSQLGNGTLTYSSNLPTSVKSDGLLAGKSLRGIQSGFSHSCTWTSTEVFCWGYNPYGQLGNSTTTNAQSPTRVSLFGSSITGAIASVSLGSNSSCAFTGVEIYCWGLNSSYQLGNGTITNSQVPTKVLTNSPASSSKNISSVAFNSSAGTVEFIADDRHYSHSLSLDTDLRAETIPSEIDLGSFGGRAISKVVKGANFTCYLSLSKVFCSGLNSLGQLGNGTQASSSTPVEIDTSGALKNLVITDLVAGQNHACVIASSKVFCWGSNSVGQLGVSDERDALKNFKTIASLSPVAVNTSGALRAEMQVQSILATPNSTCVTASGQAFCWGAPVLGFHNLSPNGGVDNYGLPIALRDQGELSGKRIAKLSVSDYFDFYSGSSSSGVACALTVDSQLYCWSNNKTLRGNTTSQDSQPVKVDTVNLGERPISDIEVSNSDACLISLGEVYCWGRNQNGQLGIGNLRSQSRPIAAISQGLLKDREVLSIKSVGSVFTLVHRKVTTTLANERKRYLDLEAKAKAVAEESAKLQELSAKNQKALDISNSASNLISNSVETLGLGFAGTLGSKDSNRLSAYRVTLNSGLTNRISTYISTGMTHSCAIGSGDLYCWGNNRYGQIGNSSNYSIPTKVGTSALNRALKFDSVSAGGNHTCGIAEGSIFCFGNNRSGQLGVGNTETTSLPTPIAEIQPKGERKPEMVSVGFDHTCALISGLGFCWGANGIGQLGDGTTVNSNIPVAVNTSVALKGKSLKLIASGAYHSCAANQSEIFCWGANGSGQLGDGTRLNSNTPVAVDISGIPAPRVIQGLSAGSEHTCAIISGKGYCWGENSNGSLGDGTNENSNLPVEIESRQTLLGRNLTDISTNSSRTCAIASGAVYCWGSGSSFPVKIDSPYLETGYTYAVSAGASHHCAISKGRVFCWGDNSQGQLGNGTNAKSDLPIPTFENPVDKSKITSAITWSRENDSSFDLILDNIVYTQAHSLSEKNELLSIPTKSFSYVPLDGQKITKAVRGFGFACYLVSGEVFCTGDGQYGELGIGKIANTEVPLKIDMTGELKGLSITDIAAGARHVCATASARVFCWGSNSLGQSGGSDERDSFGNLKVQKQLSPIEIKGGETFRGRQIESIELSGDASCVIASGEPFCWGQLPAGFQGRGENVTNSSTPTSLSSQGDLKGRKITRLFISSTAKSPVCALSEGKPYCWSSSSFTGGNPNYSSSPVAVDLSVIGDRPISTISVSSTHSCALSLGELYCWGNNSYGALGTGNIQSSSIPVRMNYSDNLKEREVIAVATGNYGWSIPTTIFLHKQISAETKKAQKQFNDAEAAAIAEAKAIAKRELDTATERAKADLASSELERERALAGTFKVTQTPKNVSLSIFGVSTSKVESALRPHSADPKVLFDGKTVTSVFTGLYSTCALAGGSLYCWGEGSSGQLGNGTFRRSATPVQVKFPEKFARSKIEKVSIGSQTACAIVDSTALCWGANPNGLLGNAGQVSVSEPSLVDATGVLKGLKIQDISVSNSHACVIANARAYCWGANFSGQLGVPISKDQNSFLPVAVSTEGALSGKSLVAIATGEQHTCAQTNTEVFCWGNSAYGAAGSSPDSSGVTLIKFPNQNIKKIQGLTLSNFASCALVDGTAFCWGFNNGGRFARAQNTLQSASTPVEIEMKGPLLGREMQSIELGSDFACALASGALYCWGANNAGQLGSGNLTANHIPGPVTGKQLAPGNTYSLSVASSRSCAVASGRVYCWGYDPISTINKGVLSTPTEVGAEFNDIEFASTLKMRGDSERGSYTLHSNSKAYNYVPEFSESLNPLSFPTAVSNLGVLAGSEISDYVKKSSNECFVNSTEIFCRGQNSRGQLGNGTTNFSDVPIAVDTSTGLKGLTINKVVMGSEHVCVLASGRVFCWGDNSRGQLGVSDERDSFGNFKTSFSAKPVQVDSAGLLKGKRITDIEASNSSTCVIASGEVSCWGVLNPAFVGYKASFVSGVAVSLQNKGQLTGKNITSISTNDSFSLLCVIAENRAYCLGGGYPAIGSMQSNSYIPVPVGDKELLLRPVSEIEVGPNHSCLISMGEVYCWGANSSGQLGTGDIATRQLPTPITKDSILEGREVISVAINNSNTLVAHRALSSDKAREWDILQREIAAAIAEEELAAKKKAEAELKAKIEGDRTATLVSLQSKLSSVRAEFISTVRELNSNCQAADRKLSAQQRLAISRTSISYSCDKFSEALAQAQNSNSKIDISDVSELGFARSNSLLSSQIITFQSLTKDAWLYFSEIEMLPQDFAVIVELEQRYENSAIKHLRDLLTLLARIDRLPISIKNTILKRSDYRSAAESAKEIEALQEEYDLYRSNLKNVTKGSEASQQANSLASLLAQMEEHEGVDLKIRSVERAIPPFLCSRAGQVTPVPKSGKCPAGAKRVATK